MLFKSFLALGSLAASHAAAASVSKPRSASPPSAFDGPYLNPAPGPSNPSVEWWWFHAVAPISNGVMASVELNFYEGFTFSLGPNDPRYRFDVSGVFHNGTSFLVSTPLTSAPTITTSGQGVKGSWGGLGTFSMASDRSSIVIELDAPQSGLSGSLVFKNRHTAAHSPCNGATSGLPTFSSLAKGKTLNAAETALYTQVGWAISVPSADVAVDINVQGTQLLIDNAVGYHDHNFGPAGFDTFAYTWINGEGSCGPFDVTYLEVQALGSSRDKDILTGFLSYNGQVLQNQCSTFGEGRTQDTLSVALTGETTAPTGQQVPTGVTLDYTLANGTHYVFNLQNKVDNPAQLPYHRWRMTGSGGQVGGQQYECTIIGDWLNPGLAPYTEGSNIFEQQ